jgi:hypothetical protein
MNVYLAQLETAHFSFECIHTSEAYARLAMEAAWRTHRAQTGATGQWSEFADSVNVTKMRLGHVYRDGTRIWRGQVISMKEAHT